MGLMQKIREEKTPLVEISESSQEKNSLPEISPCKKCHGEIFWESIYRDGVFRCEVCEPSPSPRMIGRRLSCGAGPASPTLAEPSGVAANDAEASNSIPDSPDTLATRLASNIASGNCTGNDWADARRRGRLAELVEAKRVDNKTGEIHEVTGYPKFINSRFSIFNPLSK